MDFEPLDNKGNDSRLAVVLEGHELVLDHLEDCDLESQLNFAHEEGRIDDQILLELFRPEVRRSLKHPVGFHSVRRLRGLEEQVADDKPLLAEIRLSKLHFQDFRLQVADGDLSLP